jgi:hypothetical protein
MRMHVLAMAPQKPVLLRKNSVQLVLKPRMASECVLMP